MILLQEGDEQRMALADRRTTDEDEMTILLEGISYPVEDSQSLFFKLQPEEYLNGIDFIEVECVLVKGCCDDASLIGILQTLGRPLAAVTCVCDKHKRSEFSLCEPYFLYKWTRIQRFDSASRMPQKSVKLVDHPPFLIKHLSFQASLIFLDLLPFHLRYDYKRIGHLS